MISARIFDAPFDRHAAVAPFTSFVPLPSDARREFADEERAQARENVRGAMRQRVRSGQRGSV